MHPPVIGLVLFSIAFTSSSSPLIRHCQIDTNLSSKLRQIASSVFDADHSGRRFLDFFVSTKRVQHRIPMSAFRMRNLTATICLTVAVLLGCAGEGFALPPYSGNYDNCFGAYTWASGNRYVGEWGMANSTDRAPISGPIILQSWCVQQVRLD